MRTIQWHSFMDNNNRVYHDYCKKTLQVYRNKNACYIAYV